MCQQLIAYKKIKQWKSLKHPAKNGYGHLRELVIDEMFDA